MRIQVLSQRPQALLGARAARTHNVCIYTLLDSVPTVSSWASPRPLSAFISAIYSCLLPVFPVTWKP